MINEHNDYAKYTIWWKNVTYSWKYRKAFKWTFKFKLFSFFSLLRMKRHVCGEYNFSDLHMMQYICFWKFNIYSQVNDTG